MKIIILTSKNHLYANRILSVVMRKGVFRDDELFVFEQNSIIPGKSSIGGLLRYLCVSGLGYVVAQLTKNALFSLLRFFAQINGNRTAFYFPYCSLQEFKGARTTLNRLKSPRSLERLRSLHPDLILSILSKEIIPSSILALPPLGCINVHPAPLPFYRGVSPTFWCMANDERTTGVTLHYMDRSIDTGAIIDQEKVTIAPSATEHHLYVRCADIAARQIAAVLVRIKEGKAPMTITGSEKLGSYNSLPTREAVRRFRKNGFRFFTFREMLHPRA